MNVKKLIKELKKCDQDRIVILSSDSEGNRFSPVYELCKSAYRDGDSSDGEVGLEKLTDELKKAGYSKEDVMTDGVPAIVLYPR